ncbi:uncharacterized protein [Heterodontus francisci]|uniref:uncharacterized protein isoform X2 n=1 Tax=Heterodontus francisci TaxID=7792 RepID=UPI00355C62D7
MKLTLITVAVCVVLLAAFAESTPTAGPEVLNVTLSTRGPASMVERIMMFQDHVRQWANQLSEKTSTWFSDLGKKFGGFGKKAK